jgi:multidrug transporter EmrE-like cation transporter
MLWKLIVVGLGLTTGDVFMKQWMLSGASFKNTSFFLYLIALVVYGTSLTLYAYQLRSINFGIATITPVLTNIVAVSLLSFFYYKDGLSFYQGVGIALALISIVLFSK